MGAVSPASTIKSAKKLHTVSFFVANYLQGDFNGHLYGLSWGGNLGVRLVRTEDAAVGYGQILTDITAIPNDPTGDYAKYANNG